MKCGADVVVISNVTGPKFPKLFPPTFKYNTSIENHFLKKEKEIKSKKTRDFTS